MTLTIAWVRQSGKNLELVFASDSRLSSTGYVDHCQKIFPLPREDCCIAFSGSTLIAYPFILQLQNTILEYKRSFDREIDVTRLKTRVLSLLNFFIGAHKDSITEDLQDDLNTKFIFGGWSWVNARFFLWELYYNPSTKRYVASSVWIWRSFGVPQTSATPIRMIGNYIPEFQAALRDKLGAEIKIAKVTGEPLKLNYEPLTVLAEMLRDPDFTDRRKRMGGKIGGAPQVAKVYPFMRTVSFAVEWDIGKKFVYSIRGRVIADFELFSVPGIDPFTGETRIPVRGRDDNIV